MKDGKWFMQKNYLCSITETTVYFVSIKEHVDLAYYDTITGVIYFNTLYDGRFRKARKQILKDFKPEVISSYMEWLYEKYNN